MSDINDRLDALECDRTEQRRRWIAAAAKNAGLHDRGLAAKLIDASTVVTSADADRAVSAFVEQHPYMAGQKVTGEEQRRIWGQQLLDMLDRS